MAMRAPRLRKKEIFASARIARQLLWRVLTLQTSQMADYGLNPVRPQHTKRRHPRSRNAVLDDSGKILVTQLPNFGFARDIGTAFRAMSVQSMAGGATGRKNTLSFERVIDPSRRVGLLRGQLDGQEYPRYAQQKRDPRQSKQCSLHVLFSLYCDG